MICAVDTDGNGVEDFVGYQLPLHQISLPQSLSEDLLHSLMKHHKLTDENFQMFGYRHTNLGTVDIMHVVSSSRKC